MDCGLFFNDCGSIRQPSNNGRHAAIGWNSSYRCFPLGTRSIAWHTVFFTRTSAAIHRMGQFHGALADDRSKPGVRHNEEDDEEPRRGDTMFGEENHFVCLVVQQSCHEGGSRFQWRLKLFKIENENSFRKFGKNKQPKGFCG